jgi:hypothetical protein
LRERVGQGQQHLSHLNEQGACSMSY